MLKNYFNTAIRNLIKTKLFSFINIFGLTIGMTVFLLILHYVNFQKSYDRFQPNSERIYRLRYERTDKDGQAVRFASCCPPAGILVREMFPEVKKVGRVFRTVGTVAYEDKMFFEERIFFAEKEFLSIFKFKFIKGDPLTGISEPNKAFISSSMAKKYFGNKDPINQIISIDKRTIYQITGVFEDIPENSHIKFDFLLSYKSLIAKFGEEVEQSWGDSGWYTYLLFKKNADLAGFNKKLTAFLDKEINEYWKVYNLRMDLILQPLTSIHLNSTYQQEFEVNGDEDTVDFLSIIAILVILIAWVNYINLSTAHSLTRAREVGLRKVVGASRFQLIVQFFFETILVNILAVFLTLLLILIFLPEFSNITGVPNSYTIWNQSWFWLAMVIIFIVGIFLSGLYPILMLSSFKPSVVLKGKLGSSTRGKFSLRKGLVVVQFVMAIALITFTLAIFEQLNFMKNYEPGFNREKILVVRAPRVKDKTLASKYKTLKEELISNSLVSKFCFVTEVPGKQVLWDAGGIFRVGSDENKNYQIVGMDADFVDVFKLKLAAGRNFSLDFPADSSALILNETAAQWLGFKNAEDAIGKKVSYWEVIYTVVGVLKNYHQQSLKQAFEPHIFRYLPTGRDSRGCLVMKFHQDNPTALIKTLQKKYNQFFPGNAFEYFFLDEYYNQQYKPDELFGKVFSIFAFLAIFVTCLGVLGLSSFMVVQKTKEIGIRKVLGAKVINIIILLIKDFIVLILIAFVLCVPLSYFFILKWLESFAVKMDISVSLFIIPLVLVFIITVATVSVYVIKAALSNPVNALRYE
ncbi:MAG: ABC transporter permease [bacterium]